MFAEPRRNHAGGRRARTERPPNPVLEIGELVAQRRLREMQLLAGRG